MGAINFNDGPPYHRLDIASAQAAATSDGVEIALTAYVFGQPAATVPFAILLDPSVARRRGDGTAQARRRGVIFSIADSGPGQKSCDFEHWPEFHSVAGIGSRGGWIRPATISI